MKNGMRHGQVRLVLEIVIWSVFLGLPMFVLFAIRPIPDPEVMKPVAGGVLIAHSMLIAYYYFNYFFALPRFYFTRKYHIFFPLTIVVLLGIIMVLQTNRLFNPIPREVGFSRFVYIFSIVIRFIIVFLLSLGFQAYSRLKQIEEEQLRNELSYLKAQINPHFLFNTLNSIYALAVRKADTAPQAITSLSSMMRYAITEAAADTVTLEKELNYLRAYIDLEKLRLTDKVNLNYELAGDPEGKHIAPFIFLPLAENAFKHGVSTSESSEISIVIRIDEAELKVQVRNTKVGTDRSSANGIGLENMKKRLNLLYPGKHELLIKETDLEYNASLTISLHA
jgi:sensor histidine kinase YesM